MVGSTQLPGSATDVAPLQIGLFGGTFDPPHIGHLVLADQVKHIVELDEVVFMVANQPWQKEGTRKITPAETRVALATVALESADGLSVSDLELQMGGESYTINTVAALKDRYSKLGHTIDVHVIVGSDAAAGLNTWHDYQLLREMVEVVVVNRPGGHGVAPGWRTRHIAIPPLDISSTQLRASIRAGRSVRYLTLDRVIAEIDRFGLYRD